MPAYEFRCKACRAEFTLRYASVADYEAAAERACPRCGASHLDRIIRRVQVKALSRDFTKMSSDEMLGVLESGDTRQVGAMFDQIGGADPEMGAEYHEVTKSLLRGDSMEKVERQMEEIERSNPTPSSPAGGFDDF